VKGVWRAHVGVNCDAIPTSLIASELFGHERRVHGRYAAPSRPLEEPTGHHFLAEVGDLPPDIRVALCAFFQDRKTERRGRQACSSTFVCWPRRTRDLDRMVNEGKFARISFTG